MLKSTWKRSFGPLGQIFAIVALVAMGIAVGEVVQPGHHRDIRFPFRW